MNCKDGAVKWRQMAELAAAAEDRRGTWKVKAGLAEMLKGGVIMDVVTPEQAKIAEDAGAVAVMALERVPADEEHHIDKHPFKVPFVCGCRDLGEALRRIAEGAAMIRTKGEAGTGNVVEAVRHMRAVSSAIRKLHAAGAEELVMEAKRIGAPLDLLEETARLGRLPVVNFAAGGIATPADAALMMQLGCDGVFVGSGIFKSEDPGPRARAIDEAVTHYQDASI